MHTARRFFLALFAIVVGITVPMTVSPGDVTLAVLWSLLGLTLLGVLTTWEPVARRLPYRVVRNVAPTDLPPETLTADAALADDCERLADDIESWYKGLGHELDDDDFPLTSMPADWSSTFDGRIFRVMEALVARRYVTRDDLRRLTHQHYLGGAAHVARYVRSWAHRLRRG